MFMDLIMIKGNIYILFAIIIELQIVQYLLLFKNNKIKKYEDEFEKLKLLFVKINDKYFIFTKKCKSL